MGLDMYLNKKYYVKNWGHNPPEEKYDITIKRGGFPSGITVEKIKYVETEEMYWRKANAIHSWFVRNIQDEVNDCDYYYVSTEQLKKLLSVVETVLNDHSKAEELLPTQKGFFFGSIEYDEYYFKDLEYTRNGLKQLILTDDTSDLYYHSSW